MSECKHEKTGWNGSFSCCSDCGMSALGIIEEFRTQLVAKDEQIWQQREIIGRWLICERQINRLPCVACGAKVIEERGNPDADTIEERSKSVLRYEHKTDCPINAIVNREGGAR